MTIYKRGDTYWLYYRQDGTTHRQKIDGNLAVARATAHKVGDALAEERSPAHVHPHRAGSDGRRLPRGRRRRPEARPPDPRPV